MPDLVLYYLRRFRDTEQPHSEQNETFDISSGHHDYMGHLHLLHVASADVQSARCPQNHRRCV